jgi:Ca-activated chloride channel homolog
MRTWFKHPKKTLSKLLAALLMSLQLVPSSYAFSDKKQAVALVESARPATHFIANPDPHCPRSASSDEPNALFKLGRMQSSGAAVATLTAPPPPVSPATPPSTLPSVAPATNAAPRGTVAAQASKMHERSKSDAKLAASPQPVQAAAPSYMPQHMAAGKALADDAARQQVSTKKHDPNPIKRVATDPVSTFSIDVDTGSYASVRGLLRKGQQVPFGAVRVEEMINYFDYAYTRPEQSGTADRGAPFAVNTEIAPSPWNASNHLLRVGIQARDAAKDSLPPANLVFLIDVSGSMNIPASLPLVQDAMLGLVQQLRAQDRVSIVTYAAGTQVVLTPTAGSDKIKIADTICSLRASGSTAGASGIQLAYEQAKRSFIAGGINRILLATDGDFNVGVRDVDQLKEMVASERKHGISLSTLGVGYASYNDHLMEQVADAGDGKYSFMDSLQEGRKVLVNEFTSTLQTVAQDVKLQLEFNPSVVKEYRLIGYENRQMAREDFSNDAVDAGDIGAGHRVTALYEITLVGQNGKLPEERYSANRPAAATGMHKDELAYMKIRYKAPSDNPTAAKSQEISQPILASGIKTTAQASSEFKFAAAVAGFGQIMAQGKHLGAFSLADVSQLASAGLGEDKFGLRKEFVELVKLSQSKGEKVGQIKIAP